MGQEPEDGIESATDSRFGRRELIQRAGALGVALPLSALVPGAALAGRAAESFGSLTTTYRSLNASGEPARIDPLYPTSDGEIRKVIFEGLIGNSPAGGDPVNVLAQTFKVSKDRRTIDFTLKRGIRFHRGFGEVTAADVKFSLERAAGITPSKDPSGVKGFFEALERVVVLGKYAGRLVLKNPSVTLLNAGLNEFPSVILSKKAFTTLGETAHFEKPVGTGPYQVGKWNHGRDLTMNTFKEYSGAAPWVPKNRFKSYTYLFIRDDTAAEAAYDTGQLDWLGIPSSAANRFRSKKNTVVFRKTTSSYQWIGMNVLDPALKNKNLRLAIRRAIDVPSILEAIGGTPTRAYAMVAPSNPIGYWKDAPHYPRNVSEARRLLRDVPSADKKLTFTFANPDSIIAQVAQQNLAEVGLDVTLVPLTIGGFYINGPELRKRQLYTAGYGPIFVEPTSEFIYHTCGQLDIWNYNEWCNRQFTDRFNRAQSEFDRTQRNKTYIEMQKIWDRAANAVWLYHGDAYYAARKTALKPLFSVDGRPFPQSFRPV